jgi:flagellar basal body-associated protein FliL
MDSNRWHSVGNAENNSRKTRRKRRWIIIICIIIVILAIIGVTLGLLLKFVILKPKESETPANSTDATSSFATTDMAAETSMTIPITTQQPSKF